MEMVPVFGYDLFLSIMENLPLAVLLIDQDYDYIYCNTLFLTFSKLSYAQLEGMSWSQFLPLQRQTLLFAELSRMKNHGLKSHGKCADFAGNNDSDTSWTIAKGCDEKLGEFYVLTFKGQPHVPALPMSSSHDISTLPVFGEKKKISSTNKNVVGRIADLEKINEELKASNKLKDKVLSVIAHDVRGPIASLKGLTSTFLDNDLNSEERVLLREDLLKQLGAVSDLTENILLWATNSFVKTKPETKEALSVLDVVQNNRPVIDYLAFAKDITIQYKIPADLKIFVNKDQFSMVIRNLSTNAIKYTPLKGHIIIEAVMINSCVRIRITDNGIGIDEDHQKALFTFSQSNTYGTNGEKGIGLGLLLCKEYVEANGGTISVFSELNVGTTVVTEFPAAM